MSQSHRPDPIFPDNAVHDQAEPASCPVTGRHAQSGRLPQWDPRRSDAQQDQIAAYDAMRRQEPLAQSPYGYVSVFRHADVLRIVEDHDGFSSAVSRFPSVPNGMDPPEHTPFRRLIEPYFDRTHMDAFAPQCREIALDLVSGLPRNRPVELIGEFAQIFALRIQCAWLGWPSSLHEPLRQWTLRNHTATLSRDRDAQEAVARDFDGYIKALLSERRKAGDTAPDDITTHLMHNRSLGRLLTEDEIISILRNWTVGELGTIAASVGILVHYMAEHPEVQQHMRDDAAGLPAAIDEILRIHPPLIMNRRVARRDADISGHVLPAGTRLAVLWASANRDEAVFGDPDIFDPQRDPALNLLYGAGIHICPGAPLARLELLAITEALLAGTRWLSLSAESPPLRACYPGSGFASLFVEVDRQ